MNHITTLFCSLILIIASEFFYPQYLERYDSSFDSDKREQILKFGIKTENVIEKITSTKSSATSAMIRNLYYDKKGNFVKYEFYEDTLRLIPTSTWDYYTDESRNTIEVFDKGKLTAKRVYDEEDNTTLEINIDGEMSDTVEQNEYTYIDINGEKLLTSIVELRTDSEIENCNKYFFDYDSLGRMIHRRDYWPNGTLSMENHWNYDSLTGYTKSFSSDGETGTTVTFKINDAGEIIETKNYVPEMNYMATTVNEYNKEGKLILQISRLNDNYYRGEMKYDDNGNILESKLFQNESLQSSATYIYYNNGLLQQRLTEDFNTGSTIIKNYKYEFY